MRVIICAGEKTDAISKYLRGKSSLMIDSIDSVLDAITRIENGGFVVDKVVVFGFALDQLDSEEAIATVFESLAKIANEIADTKEILIVNKGAKGRNYDKLFFKYLQGIQRARFDDSEQVSMRDIEQIISGSISSEAAEPGGIQLKAKSSMRGGSSVNPKSKKKPLFNFGSKKSKVELPQSEGAKSQKSNGRAPIETVQMAEVPGRSEIDRREEDQSISFGSVRSEALDVLETSNPGTSRPIPQIETVVDTPEEGADDYGCFTDEPGAPEHMPESELRKDFQADEPIGAESVKRGTVPDKKQRTGKVKAAPPEKKRENQTRASKTSKPVKSKGSLMDIFSSKSKPPKASVGRRGKEPEDDAEEAPESKPQKSRMPDSGIFKPDKAKIAELQKRSKIILVTGNARAGKSSTVANLAYVAQALGLSTLILDMDFRGRGMSLLFPQEINPEENYYTCSISNAIRSPYAYEDFLWEITDNLGILGMDISVGDIAMHEAVVTGAKLSELLSTVRTSYDLILIDMPIYHLKKFGSAISLADRIAYVTENDVASLVNIINNMGQDAFETIVDLQIFRSKCGFIINRYNPTSTLSDNIIEPDNLTLFLDRISDEGEYSRYPVFGTVEEIPNFSKQMDGGYLLCESNGFDRVYFDMLYCLYM